MNEAAPSFNPFPGLRPFEADEDHLFFGREREVDELLRRLRTTRFLAVVGTSGSGKSSLIRSGLIPALYSGFMAKAGTSWRIATLRPGEDPFAHLAAALAPADILGGGDPELAATQPVLIEASLRRSPRGLVEAVRLARLKPEDNLLVVVDQFEELFRFRRNRQVQHARDEAIAFVRLLLEAARQTDFRIFVVLTMRSDFIGDCMEYPGLAEAVNDGQYLVPRMSRDALRAAITGPVAVAGGQIAPRLVMRLLNEIGDDHDELPVLQHALMRSWDHWASRPDRSAPLDIADYEAIGTMAHALSVHAEEAFAETGAGRGEALTARVFKALTDTYSDPRGVRRPTSVGELCAIGEASEAEIVRIVDIFRRPGRSFLMPPAKVPLTARSIVDISHESLMRCWERLITWAEEERTAAAFYVRLAQASDWHGQGTAALWRDPELELALRWKTETAPTAAWAHRVVEGDAGVFERAMTFLDRSEAARAREQAEREHQRRRKLRQARWAAAVLGVLLLGMTALAVMAWRERLRATVNFGLARAAVDQTLSSVDVDPVRAGADVPQVAELRRGLLERAKQFSLEFLKQDSRGAELREETALAHLRLGHISRMMNDPADAESEYRTAIAQLEALEREHPSPSYEAQIADANNWIGETLRAVPSRAADAAAAYERALALQTALVAAHPDNAGYRQQLARTYGNRAILRASAPDASAAQLAQSEADFREALKLLEPLAAANAAAASQELARTANNLAALVAANASRGAEAAALYDRAITTDEKLVAEDPSRRVYKLELAQFLENDADLARASGDLARATARNARALALLDELLLPAPSLGIEHADAHDLRGRILAAAGSPEAVNAYAESLRLFAELEHDAAARRLPAFHQRFGDLLLNLADLSRESGANDRSHRLLAEAVARYAAHAEASLAAGDRTDAQLDADNFAALLPELGAADRLAVGGTIERIQARLTPRR
jgi:hypothetical protein